MKQLVTSLSPDGCPVEIVSLTCEYQAQKEGVFASVEFTVRKPPDASADESESAGEKPVPKGRGGAEAVEFTFVLYDIFDGFLASRQGVAGPGKYMTGRKKHRARWVFEIDAAFSQYHALCFPSQVRLLDGRIWRCNRDECIRWLNEQMSESSAAVTSDDVFADGGLREGASE